MSKVEFINDLRRLLATIDIAERNKFIAYYEEMIEDYKECGDTEEEVIRKIGSPKNIADNILKEQGTIDIKIPRFKSSPLNIILLILGFPLWGSLLLAFVLVIFAFYLTIGCIPFTTAVTSVAFFGAGLLSIIVSPIMISEILPAGIAQLGAGISLIGFSIILGVLTIFLSKKLFLITKIITNALINVFKRTVVRV
ncbi:DUF1700 domain-containing protein [uncultured Clostridium sp.]|jgi:uncharacterized membrane protein|uniref:DUF1700 domain-containing protein n=1 Tax=uncultured Clostridium sp. TaxID=59620 RepID=UPI0026180385|nr:DUF1700 domain-containing protein [uncultured Clostridium sp.]